MHCFKILFFTFCICTCFLSCKKSSTNPINNRDLNNLEKKMLGKWTLDNVSGFYTEKGYWVFKTDTIDSLSTATRTFRLLELRTGACTFDGYWELTKDSVLSTSCIGLSRLTKLTDTTMVFHYDYVPLDYIWKR